MNKAVAARKGSYARCECIGAIVMWGGQGLWPGQMQTALELQRKIPNIRQIMNGGEVREHFQEELSCRMSSGGQATVRQKHGVWGRDEECFREKNSMCKCNKMRGNVLFQAC